MRNKVFPTLAFLFLSFLGVAQVNAPEVQNVYGGRILDITGYSIDNTTSRIFISTESANSAFYTDVENLLSGNPTFQPFQDVPALNAEAGLGAGIQKIGVIPSTGILIFSNNGLFAATNSYTNVKTVYSNNVEDFVIVGNMIFFTSGPSLHFGTIDSNGVLTESANSPIAMSTPGGMVKMAVHPTTGVIYFLYEGGTPALFKTSDTYSALSAATTFNAISVTLTTTANWRALGIAPDGRIFLGGNGSMKTIAYSDDEIAWTDMTTMGGVAGSNFAFGGDASAYSVYFASTYSNNKGVSGTWSSFGQPGGAETHPNDGVVFADPTDSEVVYMTSDQGIAASKDKGETIFEIDDGVEAVQVNDFDMEGSKNTAWIASKSGIRRVTDYQSTPVWTGAIFPNNDGSPYYTSEMNQTNNDIVFVGNSRVYRTEDNGTTWSKVFSAEQAPYNFPGVGSEIRAIEICNEAPNIVMAGYFVNGNDNGGLFVSEDGGNNWDQILIDATTNGSDVDIHDIEFSIEGSDTIAYVGVEYEMSGGYSIYKVTKSGSTWTVDQDMSSGNTSTGSVIVVTIRDLEISTTGDTIFAAGTDVGVNNPHVYYKPLNSTGLWTPFTTSGLPNNSGKPGNAVTIGMDTLYCAVENDIYYFVPATSTSWQLGYSYPNGTKINFLYFDDLLAGTGTGLYEHPIEGSPVSTKDFEITENRNLLQIQPNPLSEKALIRLNMPYPGLANIQLYDINGHEVLQLENSYLLEGLHEFSFDPKVLTNGTYFCTLRIGDYIETKQLIKVD